MWTAAFQFSESSSLLNSPDLFTELPCRNHYQTPHSLNASGLFTENPFFTKMCFVASTSQKSAPTQARKRNPNPNFWVRISSSGVGVFHVKGWGPKSSVCPSKPGEPNFFGSRFRTLLGPCFPEFALLSPLTSKNPMENSS